MEPMGRATVPALFKKTLAKKISVLDFPDICTLTAPPNYENECPLTFGPYFLNCVLFRGSDFLLERNEDCFSQVVAYMYLLRIAGCLELTPPHPPGPNPATNTVKKMSTRFLNPLVGWI